MKAHDRAFAVIFALYAVLFAWLATFPQSWGYELFCRGAAVTGAVFGLLAYQRSLTR